MVGKMFISDGNQRDFYINLIIKEYPNYLIILRTRESDTSAGTILNLLKNSKMIENLNLSAIPAFGYRFKIISKQSNTTLGTGVFRSNEGMTETEQVNFLHQYTNGVYLGKESLIDIYIFETNE